MEPSLTAVKTLFALSANVCGFQHDGEAACEERMTDPGWRRVKGEICHIRGEKPTSARYDAEMTDPERHGYSNLILLCPNHHTLIDDLEPETYPVEVLTEMKARAEGRVDEPEWAADDVLTGFAESALRHYERMQAVAAAPQPPPPAEALGDAERLGALRLELDTLIERAAEIGAPGISDGPHLPWYRAWMNVQNRAAVVRGEIAAIEDRLR